MFVPFLVVLASSFLVCQGGQVCYYHPPIGCFSNEYPFNNTRRKLPDSIAELDVHYIHILGQDRVRFGWNQTKEVMAKRYDPSLKTCVIIHGWNENLRKTWIEEMVQELLKKGNINVIVVDWAGGAKVVSYLKGIVNGRVVGAMTAYFLQELISLGAEPSSFHLIGNSLGGHIAGTVGFYLKGIGRITGLDPSGRKMAKEHTDVRLDPSDAKMVDVIHTDGARSIKFGFGSMERLGTIDFYVNGGKNQPGCSARVPGILVDMIYRRLGFNKCSHSLAHNLFTSSINGKCSFVAGYCDSVDEAENEECIACLKGRPCAVFGFDLKAFKGGIYAMRTNKNPPYCYTSGFLLG